MIDILEIEQKQKMFPLGEASANDFTYRHVGEADPSVLTTDPTVSLYCLDHPARRAIFVQVPEGVDVTAGPFLYLSQYEHASRLLAVPYDVFHQVAAGIDLQVPLVLIHSTGRAGSTLLSKAFADMSSVTSLSEPDIYTQAVALRLGGVDDDDIEALLGSATRILFNPTFTQGSALHVIKFRSFCIELGDILHRAFPDAGGIFLYRDVAAYLASMMRALVPDEVDRETGRAAVQWVATVTPLLATELKLRNDLDPVEVLCLGWLSVMRTCARMHQQGVPLLSVRYEEVVADPRGMLSTIFAYLGLPADSIDSALRAFSRDSQAGSPLARKEAAVNQVGIDQRRWALVEDLMRRYPITDAELAAASVTVP